MCSRITQHPSHILADVEAVQSQRHRCIIRVSEKERVCEFAFAICQALCTWLRANHVPRRLSEFLLEESSPVFQERWMRMENEKKSRSKAGFGCPISSTSVPFV